MATIQAKITNGHKYWYIVESRRVNGKPRPVVLEYLGKPEDLLRRLQQGIGDNLSVKSHSHGAVAALLDTAKKLDIVEIINRYIHSQRRYWPDKPLRNGLTAGVTLLLAAVGRVCMPTSKRGWWKWAQNSSCEYLLRIGLSKVDSQHFWDMMDCLTPEGIQNAELDILRNAKRQYSLKSDTLFYDTTNFYTFIATDNERCDLAQRARNKQKRHDLRQVGLALIVTREDYIPLFHQTYKGNINDSKVFQNLIKKIRQRMADLNMDLESHTMVFDRGCNSKQNLATVSKLGLHYVGALTPSHHQKLIRDADENFEPVTVGDKKLLLYRDKRIIWGQERTVIVYISEKLKTGQLRGVYQTLEKKKQALKKLQESLANPRTKKRTREELVEKIEKLLKGQFMEGLVCYELNELANGRFLMTYDANEDSLQELEDKLGFRILMTDRHAWPSEEIVQAYRGQSTVEKAFKNIKNPFHLAVTPEFHWTDQKIRVHYFSCVLGYLLATLVWKETREKAGFKGTVGNLFEKLNNIRLATLLEVTGKCGQSKVIRKLEELTDQQNILLEALGLAEIHKKPLKIKGVSVYNDSDS